MEENRLSERPNNLPNVTQQMRENRIQVVRYSDVCCLQIFKLGTALVIFSEKQKHSGPSPQDRVLGIRTFYFL